MILLTNSFPYDVSEPYLETELSYYNEFDTVDIFSLSVRKGKGKRKIGGENINVHPIFFEPTWVYIINTVRVIFDINFYIELFKLIKEKRLTISRLSRLVVFVMRARYETAKILKILKLDNNKHCGGVIYSYRFEYQAYSALLLKKHFPNYKIVARAHGYDLHEYANKDNYIPLREKLLSSLDEVICISQHGKRYLENKYDKIQKTVTVSYLGTLDHSEKITEKNFSKLNIVSCSNVVKIKRIEKIIEALSEIKDIDIHWTHYGDGVLLEEMIQFSERALPPNVKADFRGNIPNKEVLKEYGIKDYHLFINVSESEGIPVSIMEAISFGIPAIATDVGGTNEIVRHNQNGILINKDFTTEQLKSLIIYFSKLGSESYQAFRHNARTFWQEQYNSDSNYQIFIKHLLKLAE